MGIAHYREIVLALKGNGATRAHMKALRENDNSKNQIYLGKGFAALQLLPFGKIVNCSTEKQVIEKAPVNFSWMTDSWTTEPAPNTKLILYPQYPEVRLSGFLSGCACAPSEHMQAVPGDQRTGTDGRYLILGVTPLGHIIGYLVLPDSAVAASIVDDFPDLHIKKGVLVDLPFESGNPRRELLDRLVAVAKAGWIPSQRLNSEGTIVEYRARNAGGYVLEAQFGIIPNGLAEPDFQGWELKSFSGNVLTLMTPEPDSGFYFEQGAEAFVRRFGHDAGNDVIYFTGCHKADSKNATTGLTLTAIGYAAERGKFIDLDGGLALKTDDGEVAALWTFRRLIRHWARKHARAAYLRNEKQEVAGKVGYSFLGPAWLGEGTSFENFMTAFLSGYIYLDPASKVSDASTDHSKVKARSQFRIKAANLGALYHAFTEEPL